jgi:hypothetical protein
MTGLSSAQTAAALDLLREERLGEFAALLGTRLECPEHGNTLGRYGDVTACCIKNCAYEVPA